MEEQTTLFIFHQDRQAVHLSIKIWIDGDLPFTYWVCIEDSLSLPSLIYTDSYCYSLKLVRSNAKPLEVQRTVQDKKKKAWKLTRLEKEEKTETKIVLSTCKSTYDNEDTDIKDIVDCFNDRPAS